MEAIFLKLLNMSIAAGWLIVAVIVLRWLLGRAPKGLRCVLWAIVAVRLVCPFSFESVLSLIPSAETISPSVVQYSKVPTVNTGIPVINSELNQVTDSSLAATPGDSVNPLYVWTFAASIVWVIGLAVLLGIAVFSFLRIRRMVEEAVRLRDNIYICDAVKSPFILGLIRPRIYLPSDMEETQADYALVHEQAHLKRKDHWWKPFGYVLLAVYWFNPLVWLSYILLCRDIELACDEKAIRDLNMDGKKAYSEALVACSMKRRMIMACPIAFGEVGVKERVKTVLNYKKPAFWVTVVAVVACVVVAVCFLTNPKENDSFEEVLAAAVADSEAQQEAAALEVYNPDWTEDKIIEEISKRNPYLEKCTFYGEVLNYMENVREVRDISMLFEPMFATDTKYYSEEDFQYVPSVIIRLARYEIYARHGCIFQDEDLKHYFMGQLWYLPVVTQEDFSDSALNAYEKENLTLLEELEQNAAASKEQTGTQGYYYIRGVGGNSLFLDEVEWVSDAERAAELGLAEEDMPGGFYVYNEEASQIGCSFAEECSFTILDWYNNYSVMEVDKQTFLDTIDSREREFNALDRIPFIVEIKDGKIVSVTEQYVP